MVYNTINYTCIVDIYDIILDKYRRVQMNLEDTLIDKFPAILKEKIRNKEFEFPDDTQFEYNDFYAYRCFFRDEDDNTPINREDFRSHAELGKILRGRGSKKPEYLGTSLFRTVEELNNIQSLNKPEKRVARGKVFSNGGPILINYSKEHVCWWMFEDVDLSSYKEVNVDE